MNKIKKIALLVMIPAFALVLSGCGKKPEQNTVSNTGATPNPALQNIEKPKTPTTNPETANVLPTLPADNAQAIDSELQGIDQELQAADSSLSSDTSDDELGL